MSECQGHPAEDCGKAGEHESIGAVLYCDGSCQPKLECLDDYGEGTCKGKVEYRMAMSSTGRNFPRCEKHFEERLETQQGINERYGSICPPADFDPAYAGESWDED